MDFNELKGKAKETFNKAVEFGKEHPAVAIGVGAGVVLSFGFGFGLFWSAALGAGVGYLGGTKDGQGMLKLGYDKAKDVVNSAQKRLPPPKP